jgi:hypothetical protein
MLLDVCRVLGIANSRNVSARLDDDEKGVHTLDTPGGPQKFVIINESGLWKEILRSNKPEAKRFRKWVTRDHPGSSPRQSTGCGFLGAGKFVIRPPRSSVFYRYRRTG